MIKYSPFNWITLLLSSLILLFILAPLAGMFLHTSGAELFETVIDKEVQESIWLTLWVSFAATFLFAIGSVPLAWLLARKKFPLKNVVQGIIDLPVVLPHTAAGIAILGFISRDGLLGKTAGLFGLTLINNPMKNSHRRCSIHCMGKHNIPIRSTITRNTVRNIP